MGFGNIKSFEKPFTHAEVVALAERTLKRFGGDINKAGRYARSMEDRYESAKWAQVVEVLATSGSHHATKKSPSELERDIAEALASRKVPHDASYRAVHRLAVEENLHRELAERFKEIERATHVAERPEWHAPTRFSGKQRRVAKKGDYVAYGTRADVEERVGPDQRYGIVRPITSKDRQKLMADARRVFAR